MQFYCWQAKGSIIAAAQWINLKENLQQVSDYLTPLSTTVCVYKLAVMC
jgi:hypothetical protein